MAARKAPLHVVHDAPPHDLDAEAAVLSTLLLKPETLADVAPIVAPGDFYSDANRRVAEAIWTLAAEGSAIDVTTVAARLRAEDKLPSVGGTPYLAQLVDATPAVAHVAEHAAIVAERARARRLAAELTTLAAESRSTTDVDALIAHARERLDLIAPARSSIVVLDGPALAAPLPAVDYLVRQLGLVAGGGAPHLIAGYGFSAKSVSAQALALALASGTLAWGAYTVAEPRRIAHVDLEQGDRLTRRRYQRLARAMGVDLAALGDALALLVMPGWTLAPAFAERWREVMCGRDVLLLDSLKAATPGVDENSSDVRAGLDMLGSLSESTGCRPLVLHHARKSNPDEPGGRLSIRGSSAIFDAVDSAYVFAGEKGEPVRVEHVKARTHGEPVEDFALVVSDVEVDGEPRAGLRVQLHGAELVQERREAKGVAARAERAIRDAEAVRKVLCTRPGLGSRDLRAATSLSGDRLAAALGQLGGKVEIRDESNGRAKFARHYLVGVDS